MQGKTARDIKGIHVYKGISGKQDPYTVFIDWIIYFLFKDWSNPEEFRLDPLVDVFSPLILRG